MKMFRNRNHYLRLMQQKFIFEICLKKIYKLHFLSICESRFLSSISMTSQHLSIFTQIYKSLLLQSILTMSFHLSIYISICELRILLLILITLFILSIFTSICESRFIFLHIDFVIFFILIHWRYDFFTIRRNYVTQHKTCLKILSANEKWFWCFEIHPTNLRQKQRKFVEFD